MISKKTLVALNLSEHITSKDLESYFSNIGPLKRCILKKLKGKSQITNAYLTFLNKNDAEQALHKTPHHINNNLICLEPYVNNKLNQKFDLNKIKKFRLIVRNLPFRIKRGELSEIFKKYGNIFEIELPLKKDKLNKGFAFIQYETYESAKNALETLNATSIQGRTIAIDWSVTKDVYAKHANEGTECNEKLMYEDVLDKIKPIKKENSHKKAIQGEETNLKKTKTSLNDLSFKRYPKTDNEITLFVRNIPLSVTQEEFKELFSTFGAISYALLVTLNGGKIHKGSGFVKFVNEDDALKCLKVSLATNGHNSDSNPISKNSINVEDMARRKFLFGGGSDDDNENEVLVKGDTKTPEGQSKFFANAGHKGGLYLHNQRLLVCRAVDREKLTEIKRQKDSMNKQKKEGYGHEYSDPLHLAQSGVCLDDEDGDMENDARKQQFKQKDKRNLHLLAECSLKICSKRYGGEMSQLDLTKRTKLMTSNSKKLKLLNFFVSPTRLTIHNLPKWVNRQILRLLIVKTLNDPTAKITEARVMLDLSRIPPTANDKNSTISKYRAVKNSKDHYSLGYGFVEFSQHSHALKALRAIDNNPAAYECLHSKNNNSRLHLNIVPTDAQQYKNRRPIVQFAISNRLALNARIKRLENINFNNNRRPFVQPKSDKPSKTIKNTFTNAMLDKSKKRKNLDTLNKSKKIRAEEMDSADEEKLMKNVKSIHKKIFGK